MNLKTKLTLIMMLFSSIVIIAQDNYQLKGTVVSVVDQFGIPGANVLILGTSTGASTDFDGNFEIDVKSGDQLQFSYIGYVTQIVTITDQTNLSIALTEDANTLDEVVVVGYGTQKKSHVTGSIAKVGGDDLAAIQATRVDEALAGKLAGVLIQNQNGSPGADPKIQIRAASSINGNSNPLIVVDGYPISGSLATVNPNDIESVEVLKDAASAAIYGSRGANGVILVTTKKGKEGKPSFSYNAYASISNKYKNDRINMTAGEWANTLETGIASGRYDVSELDPAFVNYKINAYKNSPDVLAVEDWLYGSGYSTNHDFSYSGGTEKSNYFASIGYQNTDGIVRTEGYERLNARLNIDTELGDKFKTGLSFNGFAADRDIVGHDQRDLLRAYSVSPIYHTEASIAFVQQLDQQAQALGLDPFDDGYRGGDAPFNNSIYTLQPGDTAQDWHYGRSGNGIGGSGDAGPATKLDNTDRYQKTYFANVSTFLQYSLLNDLDIKVVLGADIRDTKDYFWRGLEFDSRARTNQTALDETNIKQTSTLSETTLNYAKEIGKHDISAVAGVEFQKIYFRGTATAGTNVPFTDIVNYNLLDPADITVSERDETISRWSIFGRINYAFDDRYLLSASVRRDGDSRFGANERYATFPAISLGWNVHKESFYNLDFLSLLKPRFSTGSLGSTSDLGAYNSLSLLNPQATVLGTGYLIPSDIANSNLTWQTNTETNYGIDLGFINNRIRIGADYYTSDIEDILINQSVSEVFGTSTYRVNAGDVRSSGLELELTAGIVRQDNLRWDIGANFSTVKTEITDLGGLDQLPNVIYGQSGRGPVFRNYVGGEIGEMWGLETTGQVEDSFIEDPTRAIGLNSSAFYVVDQNGDGVIDKTKTVEEGGDLVKIGQNTPDFYYGFNSTVNYKGFDLSFQFQGTQGGEVWNVDPIYYNSEFGGRVRDSFDADNDGIADHNGEYYLDSNNQLDAQIQDASYLALRNLTIGYTLNSELTNKVGISSARVYLASTNLLYVWGDDYTSYNPEGVEITQSDYLGPTTYGVQVGASPIVRSFTFGFNVNF
ncbi:SusC/RagA family TonB-linked outer membrane protein [Ulvibacter antarcticus]|uniref:TonB-linked SusC/RagA family outer membrane protein n=1 Tax=Ulvibacter antarcticus TaxID=442714 RepID=A0A3L9Z0B8_9FLAO|nr:TonB-dependent receptor [Ulvibacter antarcticus]RMA64819.1 TonB-linked SusC/RagA family outer membrane protein [Ulvibacter antarcticus]